VNKVKYLNNRYHHKIPQLITYTSILKKKYYTFMKFVCLIMQIRHISLNLDFAYIFCR